MPRIGGYIITQDKMLAWGARLLGKRTEDLDWATAFCACLRRVMQFRGDLVPITYPSNVDAYMIPLKIAAYPGRTDMNICLIRMTMEREMFDERTLLLAESVNANPDSNDIKIELSKVLDKHMEKYSACNVLKNFNRFSWCELSEVCSFHHISSLSIILSLNLI